MEFVTFLQFFSYQNYVEIQQQTAFLFLKSKFIKTKASCKIQFWMPLCLNVIEKKRENNIKIWNDTAKHFAIFSPDERPFGLILPDNLFSTLSVGKVVHKWLVIYEQNLTALGVGWELTPFVQWKRRSWKITRTWEYSTSFGENLLSKKNKIFKETTYLRNWVLINSSNP